MKRTITPLVFPNFSNFHSSISPILRNWVSLWMLLWTATQVSGQVFTRSEIPAKLTDLKNNMGIAVADYDLDNDLDIFVVAKFDFNSSDKTTWSRLFQNNNDGTFTDVTREAGFRGLYNFNAEDPGFGYGVKLGASWGDYDNDGYPDLILTNYLRIQLFHNNGDGTFQEVTQAVGLTAVNGCYNTSALWWDFNRDGHLDLYITKVGLCPANQLYQNDGDGTFTQVTAQTGTSGTKSRTWMALPVDVNADGWLDLYLSNDFAANELFVNNTGTNFSDQANAFGVDISGNDKGMALGDYNHDGRPDIYITNIGNNRLLTQQPNQTFSNLAQDKNVLRAFYAWNSKFADFDLDGDEDLFVANGYQNDPIFFPDNKTNFLFKNLTREGQDSFTDWSAPANLVESSNTMGMEVFDYDNDGDLDIFLANMDDQPYFYENQTITSNSPQNQHWAKIKLTGTTSNRDGLGSVLRISAQGFTQTRFNQGAGLLSQSLQPVHVGLANADQIDSLKIIWPSGIEEVYYDLPVDKTLTLTEGSGIEIQTITNQKVYGCTDPNSCSYNPLATVDDGSCTYLPALTITGATAAGFLQTQTYTCPETAGSTYQWRVTHGEILQGQGTATVTVQWALATAGTISVKEVNTCSSIPSQMSVTLTGQNSTAEQSVARLWNEALLNAIRKDFARPTVHARNLFHTSVAMYDAWAIYDQQAQTFLIGKEVGGFQSTFAGFEANEPLQTARNKTISYAAYRLLSHRFAKSPGRANSLAIFDLLMAELGYDTQFTATDYSSGDAAALGNFIAETIINFGKQDGANEQFDYANTYYFTVNPPLLVDFPGNPNIFDPNRWQPLTLETFIDQSGNVIGENTPAFLGAEWGNVVPFSLDEQDLTTYERWGSTYRVYDDPGSPPLLNQNTKTPSSEAYQWGFSLVAKWASHLDAQDSVIWDISPNNFGNTPLEAFPADFTGYPAFYEPIAEGKIGSGWSVNPKTGMPYTPQLVPRGDFTRVLAEFWADGPDSETPPGHWFTLLNHVSDHPLLEKRLGGQGPVLDPLEWDVKSYFILGGTMHDAAVSAWSIKGWYDYLRPVSAIRYMAERGQSTNPNLPNYNVAGIPLVENLIELVQPGDELAGTNNEHIGKIKLYTWRGHRFINDPDKDIASVGWILAEDWLPYQRISFVTPPFAGYISGHSTFSRAAAEVMTLLTGDPFFPGGIGEFVAHKNEFLVFEEGPSQDIILQWATYRDAADQSGLSRIWGGIHPPSDDIPGRRIGDRIGKKAFAFAVPYFTSGVTATSPVDDSEAVTIYPNPTTPAQGLSICNVTPGMAFKIFNIQGQQMPVTSTVSSADPNCITLKTKDLPPGFYVIHNGSRSWKLVVL